jgi:heat-inducible transcriptional repressor
METLSYRENEVLGLILKNFISTAEPSGSRLLSRMGSLGLSPASIRNIMFDLEEQGYLSQPHISAGRQPTDKGYRHYVNYLMQLESLTAQEQHLIQEAVDRYSAFSDSLLNILAKVVASVSRQLGVVLAPRFQEGIFHRIHFVPVAEGKVMVVLTIGSGLANTLILEMESRLKADDLQKAANYINEKLGGQRLQDLSGRIGETLQEPPAEVPTALVRLFVENAEYLFKFPVSQEIFIDGTTQIMAQPEFQGEKSVRAIIELIEERELLIHCFEQEERRKGVCVTIGAENQEGQLKPYSIVTAQYRIGEVEGALGVMGPTRMPYNKLVPLVEYTSQILSEHFSH